MFNKFKKIKIRDICGIIIFIIVIIPSLVNRIMLKIKKKQMWLICETNITARDNGYAFFKYMNDNHNDIITYYAIDKKCSDYKKVTKYKNVVQWGSVRHYFLYMSSNFNISSHKDGNPNHSLFSILHLYLNLYNNRIFLQHGILYQNFEMFHQKNAKFKMFITGAYPEYKFVKNKFGYNKDEVKYTGLARFDYLKDYITDTTKIIYTPTWRRQFVEKDKLSQSLYYKQIIKFLNDERMDELLEKYNMELLFYPHHGLSNCQELFYTNCKNIKVLNTREVNVQKLLKSAALMITDYSSIQSDFVYMKKPIIYYQYDYKDYAEHIGKYYKDTYFDFERDGFGPVCTTVENVIEELENILCNDLKMNEKYSEKLNEFFKYQDYNNCERIYKEIIKE